MVFHIFEHRSNICVPCSHPGTALAGPGDAKSYI